MVGRWTQLGQRRVWRACRIVRADLIGGHSDPGPGCVPTRRSPAGPPALSIRPPLAPRAFCSPVRPVVRRAWACPRAPRLR